MIHSFAPVARDTVWSLAAVAWQDGNIFGTLASLAFYIMLHTREYQRLEVTMPKTDFKSVHDYIASQPEAARRILGRVRSAIRKAVPGAEEVISYGIPTYKLHSRAVLYFAGWKEHYSLYPASQRVVTAFKNELAAYEVNKGTIRLPLAEPVPMKLIGRIAKFRAKEIGEREKAKSAASKKR